MQDIITYLKKRKDIFEGFASNINKVNNATRESQDKLRWLEKRLNDSHFNNNDERISNIREMEHLTRRIKQLNDERNRLGESVRKKFSNDELTAFKYLDEFIEGKYEKIPTDVLINVFNVKLKDANDKTGVFESIIKFNHFFS